jgi:hypothetical protein
MFVATAFLCRCASRLALNSFGVALCVGFFCASSFFCANSRADIFVLQTAGQVRGELLNREESPRKNYVVHTSEGATITLDRSQVKQIIPQSEANEEFEKIRPTLADTPDDQWKLAEWCRERKLSQDRQAVLEHILELDPNHKQARAALGYTQRDGQWMLPDDVMQQNGYVKFNNRWMLPQEKTILERKQSQETTVRTWFVTLKKLREWLKQPAKYDAAVAEIRAINDPSAVSALAQALETEKDRDLRMLFVEALGHLLPASLNTLVNYSLDDADEEIRYHCLQQLVDHPNHQAVQEYVKALRSKDNARINTAGHALGQLKDKSAIAPLIDAIVTTHKFQVTTGGGNGQTSAGFSPTGGGSFSTGSSTRIVSEDYKNQKVLDGLVALAGGPNYGFDKAAWKRWWSTQAKPTAIDTRRD